MSEARSIASRIATPDSLEDRHVEMAAQQVLNEGLVPRDSTVLDRARKLFAAEGPEARAIWEALGLASSPWFRGVHPALEGTTLVLSAPRTSAEWLAEKFGAHLRRMLADLPEAERVERMVFRPYGPERREQPRPAPTYRERRAAA